MPAAKAMSSGRVLYAIGRQLAEGTARTSNLYKMTRMTQPQSKFASNTSDSGYTVGSGSSNQGRMLKEFFDPTLGIAAQLTTGSFLMNLLTACGYMILSLGSGLTGSFATSGAINSRHSTTVTLADATGLAVGDWIQIGALVTPGTPKTTDRMEVHEITAIATNTLTLKGRLLYKYPTATAVKKVDKTKRIRHYFKHVESDDLDNGGGDLYTVYMKASNGTDSLEVLKVDGLAGSFSPAISTGQIATFNSELKFLSVTSDPTTLAAVTVQPDPSPVLLNNTRGSFSLLGDTFNAPKSLNITLTSTIYDDPVLTQYLKQSIIHLDHALNISMGGKYVQSIFDTVNRGGGIDFTDSIPEGALQYTANSAKLIGGAGTDYYGYGINAPTCQLSGYDPEINTNQVINATLGDARVVNNESTDEEEWFHFVDNSCSTDVCSAA